MIYQGPSMPRAKLQVQPQTRMGYPEGFTAVRETTHLPGRFPAEHGRWQVCPFWPPTQNLSTQGCGCRGSSAPVPQCPQSRPAARVTPCPSILSKSYHLSSLLPPGPSSSPRAALLSSPSPPAEEGVRGIKGQELSETQTELLLCNPGSAAINAGENVLCSKAICIAACCNTFVCIVPLLFSGV